MNRNEKSLFLLTILPVLFSAVFLLWFINKNPGIDHFIIASSLFCLLLFISAISYQLIRSIFVEPLLRLNQELEEPALSLDLENMNEGTLIQTLAFTLQQHLLELENNHSDQLLATSAENTRLALKLEALEVLQDERLQDFRQVQRDKGFTDLHRRSLIILSNHAQSNFIGLCNLLLKQSSSQLIIDLKRASAQLVFLVRELQAQPYAEHSTKTVCPRQIIDESLALLQPLIEAQNIKIFPDFKAQSILTFRSSPERFKSIIFNFILDKLIANQSNKALVSEHRRLESFLLHIDCTKSDTFTLSLDLSQDRVEQNKLPRLIDCVRQMKARLSANELSIPIAVINNKKTSRHYPFSASVHTNDPVERLSLKNRLSRLGIRLAGKHLRCDLCFICFEQHEDIIKVTNELCSDTAIFLLNNRTLYNQSGWHQFNVPLEHNELVDTLNRLVRAATAPLVIFDPKLALKRANYHPKLMRELISLLIETLPGDQEKLNAAFNASNYKVFNECLHNLNGALLYSGAPKLSQSMQELTTMTKQLSALHSEEVRLALNIVNNDIEALLKWHQEKIT